MNSVEPMTGAERVLVFSPEARDVELIRTALRGSDAAASGSGGIDALCAAIQGMGVDVAVVHSALLEGNEGKRILAALRDQPEWSDYPIIVLTGASENGLAGGGALRTLSTAGNVVVLPRSVPGPALESVLVAALRSRRRQVQTGVRLAGEDVDDLVLRESQEWLRLAMQGARMGAWACDLRNGHVAWSPEMEEIFGLERGTFPGTEAAFHSMVHPEDLEKTKACITAAVHNRSEYAVEFRFMPRAGGVRWMIARGMALCDKRGEAVRLAGIGMDVTDEKTSHFRILELNRDLERLVGANRTLLDVIPVGIMISDTAECSRVTVNTAASELLGVPENTKVTLIGAGSPPFRMERGGRPLGPEETAMSRAVTQRAPVRALELDIVRADGTVRRVLEYGAPLFDERMNVRGCVGVLVDVTEQKQAEEALSHSERRFQELADSMPQMVWAARPDGYVDYYNRRWYEFTALPEGRGGDESWEPILHREDVARCHETWYGCVRTGEPYQIEYRLLDRGSGEYRWHLGRALPVRDERGGIRRWYGTCTDIHDQKLTEQRLGELVGKLNQSNDELEDFAHIASHDLKEPLRGIRNYANFLMEDHAEALGEEGRRKLATIDRLSKRMHDLLGSLLYYSRVGRSDLAVSEVDLNRLVKDVVDSLAPYLVEHSAEVRIVNPLPTLSCDPVRTAEVFSNLITNAVKYNDRTERLVEIGSKAGEGGQTAVFVRDNGIGIPENHFGTIFGIFKRLHSRDEYGGGTGSGLALSKKIVERHGGKIWLQSVVGKGSEFYFTIGAS